MPIPTDYIFEIGSCQKKDIFDLIVNKLTASGWQSVASGAADYTVLTSAGNTGDKVLVLNLRDIPAAGTVNNSVKTSNFCQMSYRLQDSYTPGNAGAAGTFGRPSLAWTDIYIAPVASNVQVGLDTVVNYKVYSDVSKIILSLEYPPATGYNPIMIYIGQPDTVYVPESASRGVIVGVTNSATTATSVMVCSTSDGMGAVTAPYALATQTLLPAKNPNNAGKYVVSDVHYGSTSEGMRGKLDGILCTLNNNLLTGDNIIIGAKTYYVLCCHTQGSTSFPSQALLVRIA